ncbi:MAG: carbohydrate-binding protein [Terracidiphilus sp.]
MNKIRIGNRSHVALYRTLCLLLVLLVIGSGISVFAQSLNLSAATEYSNLQMGTAPAMAVFNSKLYVAFRANDASNALFVTSSSDGVNFPTATGYGNLLMGSAPALAVFNNKLFVAFRANDSSNALFVTSSSDGVTFPTATGYGSIQMGGAPALAVFNNQLVIAYRANDSSNILYTTTSSDGVTFSAPAGSSADAIGSDPSLAVLNSLLYVAFRANDASNQLFVSSTSNASSFPTAMGYPGILMNDGPALTVFNNQLYVSFQADDSSNTLFLAASSGATTSGGSGGTCWAAWSSTAVYTAGGQVSYNGENYQAAYWTQGNNPATSSGAAGSGQPWIPEGSCGGGTTTTSEGFPSSATGYPAIEIGSAPAMASFNGALYVGFRSNDSRNVFFLTNSGSSTSSNGAGIFAPYDDLGNAEGETVVADAHTAGLKAITLAFLVDGGCVANWGGLGGSITSATFWNGTSVASAVNALSSEGVQVIISWGGSSGTVQSSCTNAASLQAMYQSVFNTFPNIIGQDFDIETSIDVDIVAQALAGLKSANPNKLISLTLPVMPTGLVTAGLNIVDACHADGFHPDTVNVMTMDYGSASDNGGQMGLDAEQAAQATYNQTGDKIGITPDLGVNDTSTEIFTLANAQTVESYASSNSFINRLAFWSLARDNGTCAGQSYTSPSCSGLAESQFQFASIFDAY